MRKRSVEVVTQHARIGQPRIDIEYLRLGDCDIVCFAFFFIGPTITAATATASSAASNHKHVIIPTDILPRFISRSGTLSKKWTASKCIRYENDIVFIPLLGVVEVVIVVDFVCVVSCSTAAAIAVIIICSTIIVEMTMGYPP